MLTEENLDATERRTLARLLEVGVKKDRALTKLTDMRSAARRSRNEAISRSVRVTLERRAPHERGCARAHPRLHDAAECQLFPGMLRA
jgi:hypothetical protein